MDRITECRLGIEKIKNIFFEAKRKMDTDTEFMDSLSIQEKKHFHTSFSEVQQTPNSSFMKRCTNKNNGHKYYRMATCVNKLPDTLVSAKEYRSFIKCF